MEVFFVLVLLCIGVAFNTLGAVSLFRFPDVYTRLHGATKCTTFGSIFTSLAVIAFCISRAISLGETRFTVMMIHVIVAVFALLITNATGAHAIARAAHRSGVSPRFAVVDRLAEKDSEGGASA
ncbi:MAG TPA: monovalent cation/H(+) antiporter subunit G [Synergistales bacterium]|nr:monovalent cation/H(+) antiporter subunit G [Synergistales bacterium]